jgi:O-antigen ligase
MRVLQPASPSRPTNGSPNHAGRASVLRRRIVRIALAAPPLFAVLTLALDDHIPTSIRVSVLMLTLIAARQPSLVLLIIAAVGPFVDSMLSTIGSPPIRGLETIIITFLAGWLLSEPPVRPLALTGRLAMPASLLSAIVVASIATSGLQLHRADPGELTATMNLLRRFYFTHGDNIGVVAGAALIEGVALLVAVVELTEGSPALALSLTRMLALSGVTAALLSVLLSRGIGLPPSLGRDASFGPSRFVAHIGEVNAAGSYYVLLLGLSCGMAASSLGRRRTAWLAAILLLAIGLALSGSRAALGAAAAVAAIAAAWLSAGRPARPPSWSAAGVALVTAVAIAGVMTFLRIPFLTYLNAGQDMRRDFAEASARMIAARPWFGVGVGRYHPLSHLVLSPWLATVYGNENAHDYFLQIGAELGLAGLAAFVWLFARLLSPAFRGLGDRSRDYVSAGLLAGVLGFLITCLSGHPFLVGEAAMPFWIVAALTLVASRSPSAAGSPERLGRVAGLAAILAVFASIPFRPAVTDLRLPLDRDGLGPWHTSTDGKRFRETGEYGSLFFHPNVGFVEIPLRLAPERRGHPLVVLVRQPQWSEHRIVVNDTWSVLPVTLSPVRPLVPYQRIDLHVLNDDAPPASRRRAGVEVGEISILERRE